jgi:threonine/homoserine/homoserine lactone efflux protein
VSAKPNPSAGDRCVHRQPTETQVTSGPSSAPDAEHKALAFVLLGTLFNINSVAINSGWALAAAWMARHGAVQRGMHWLDRAAGAMFIAFGVKLALSDNPSR